MVNDLLEILAINCESKQVRLFGNNPWLMWVCRRPAVHREELTVFNGVMFFSHEYDNNPADQSYSSELRHLKAGQLNKREALSLKTLVPVVEEEKEKRSLFIAMEFIGGLSAGLTQDSRRAVI